MMDLAGGHVTGHQLAKRRRTSSSWSSWVALVVCLVHVTSWSPPSWRFGGQHGARRGRRQLAATVALDSSSSSESSRASKKDKGRAWFEAAVDAARAQGEPDEGSVLARCRREGQAVLSEYPELIPQRRSEAWRFTNLNAIWSREVGLGDGDDVNIEDWTMVSGRSEDDVARVTCVTVDGVVSETLSRGLGCSGNVYVGSALSAPPEQVDLSKVVARPVEVGLETENPNSALGSAAWASLNSACLADAVIVSVGGEVELVVEVIHVSTGLRQLAHPRLLVLAKDRAKIEICQTFASTGGAPATCNSRTTLDIDPDAAVTHAYAMAHDQANTMHLEALSASCAGRYDLVAICLGGAGRLGLDCELTRPEASLGLRTLSLSGSKDNIDLRTQIRHEVPSAVSDQDIRLVVADDASATFKGRICVPKPAQQTDATQLCRTALLSQNAKVNIMPSLEIIADDVKCAHGATVADLDGESMFFLLSRGLPRAIAKALLVKGFCNSLLDTLPDSTNSYLRNKIGAKIDSIVKS